jgi:four helix bundle protein
MTEKENSKQYDLEERTFLFAQQVRVLVRLYPKDYLLRDDIGQLIRAGGSVGANYIEANEALSKKDFVVRIKICRKEAKESRYWLRLLKTSDEQIEQLRPSLEKEAGELTNIFGAIVRKSE